MMSKNTPVASSEILKLTKSLPTPFYIYDEKGMRENAKRLNKAFSWAHNFKEYFAIKATPNPFLMDIFKSQALSPPVQCSGVKATKSQTRSEPSRSNKVKKINKNPPYRYR